MNTAMKKIIPSFCMFFFTSVAYTQIINTIIGDGTSSSNGDGGPANLATCWDPKDVAVDHNGNIYFVAPQTDDKVRRIDAATNIVTTFAGTGANGFSGDGGPATAAMLDNPYGLAIDKNNNVYICDKSNYRIRKINVATNTISTIAGTGISGSSGDGGDPLQAQIRPFSIACDTAGNLIILDNNHSVRKVDFATNTITRVGGLGNGIAGYSGDGGDALLAELSVFFGSIAVGPENNIYIADNGNNRIRKIDAVTNIITTIGGTGVSGFSGDGGLATTAQFNISFSGIECDAAGNIYIADWGNNCVRVINKTTNIVTRVAGTGADSYSGDGGPALQATFQGPQGLAFDPQGNLYIADENDNRIRKVTYVTGLSNIDAASQIIVFPNPAQNQFTVSFTNPKNYAAIQLTDLQGRILTEEVASSSLTTVATDYLQTGIYLVRVVKRDGTFVTKKIVLQ